MYVSYRSKEEARAEAKMDAEMFHSLMKQAFREGHSSIIINSDASNCFLQNSNHPYLEYLNTLCETLGGIRWKLEETINGKIISLECDEPIYQKAA